MKLLHIATKLDLFHPRLFYKWTKTTELKFNTFIIASLNDKIVLYNKGQIENISDKNIKATKKILDFIKNNSFDVIHIHYPESLLLIPFIKSKIVYDVYENFLENRIYSKVYKNKRLLKIAEGLVIRTVEKNALRYIDAVIYAESSYDNFLNAKKRIVVENKFVPVTSEKIKPFPNLLNFVYTGTLSESWGIFYAIELLKKLHRYIPRFSLTIVGYTPCKKTLYKINTALAEAPFPTKIIGGNSWVPYETVQKYQNGADIGIALYITDKSIENKFPTKFYEWMALKKVFLYTETNFWSKMLNKKNAIPININKPDIKLIAIQIKNSLEKTYSYNNKKFYWNKEEILEKYLAMLDL